ncbi:MAG: hypothetical protein LHV69_05110 [Elusimicrobia bacterium]|nr:hypothetical protein [Candidatus Obscuribacterium magneticum]
MSKVNFRASFAGLAPFLLECRVPMKITQRKADSGLTVLEILIMIAVLGLVGFITLPKFKLMLYQSREGRTKASLGEIRGALAIYYSDNIGLYPSDEGTPETRLSSSLVPAYLKAMPTVDLAHYYPKKLSTVQDRFTDGGDWVYMTLHGFVAVNSNREDTKGQPLANW